MFDNSKVKDHIVLISHIHFGDVKTLIILTWEKCCDESYYARYL